MSRTRVKICGIMSKADALMAARAGADAIGMILHGFDAREIETTLAVEIANALPPLVARVGVFRDATAPFVARCARSIPLDFVQLHGNESPDFIRALQSFRVIKTVRLDDLAQWVQVDLPNLSALLIDFESEIGSNWDEISTRLRALEPVTPIIISGNLKPENVSDAIRKMRPFAVDVTGGVERELGLKSAERIESFVSAVNDSRLV